MADLIAYQDGTFNGATTWKAVATGTNAKQATTSASTNTTTSYVDSSAFTVTNTEVLEGLLLCCNRLNTTGTVSVALSDDNGTTATREVTVNASDLPADQSWVFFKFDSTLTADGGSDYKVKVKGSSAGNATFYRDATAGNWARYLRKSNAATAAAADITFICDELTGTGTKTEVAVTVSSSLIGTSYGEVNIGSGGLLKYDDTSEAVGLTIAGNVNVWGEGTLQMGTSGTRLTNNASELRISGTSVQYGLEVRAGGTWNCYGSPRTAGKNITWCNLSANAAANATSITVDADTGWLNNDLIAVAPTGTTAAQGETITVSGNAGASSISLKSGGGAGGGLLYAHGGTSPTHAEVMNLTRNVVVRGVTNASYINIAANATVNVEWTEFLTLGSASSSKRGIDVATTTGNVSFKYCSFRNFLASAICFNQTGTLNGGSVYLGYSCFYPGSSTTGAISFNLGTSGENKTLTDCCVINTGTGITMNSLHATHSNLSVSGCTGSGISVNTSVVFPTGTFTNFRSHSNTQSGLQFVGGWMSEIVGLTIFHCNGSASASAGGIAMTSGVLSIADATIIGNGGANIQNPVRLSARNLTLDGTATQSTSYGFEVQTTVDMRVEGGSFGAVTGHTSNDVYFRTSSTSTIGNMVFTNCLFSASTEISNTGRMVPAEAVIASQQHDQTAGSHKYWKRFGAGTSDTVIYKTASPSERMVPQSSTQKFIGGVKKVAIGSGTAKSINVWVRKSAAGDGTEYNGNAPRLRYKINAAAGVTSEGTLDTMTAAVGTWEQLTGTSPAISADAVLEFYVDCDGTAGWINVDDWSVT